MSRILVVGLALVLSSYAQTKPNFSGNWKLNPSASEFGMMPPPDSRSDVIEQTEGTIKDTVTQTNQQGNQNYTLTINTDGSESAVKLGGRNAKVTASWEGSALSVNTKLDFDGNDIIIKSKWTLSADGNIWTQSAHITSPMGETDTRLVFEKQGAGATSTASMPAKTPAPSTSASSSTMPSAGSHPNFSGVWKLNVSKSDFGPIPGPDGEVDTIEHNDPNLKLAVDQQGGQGNRKYELAVVINGQEETHKLGPQNVKTTTQWEGNALVVNTKLMFQDNEILIKASYTMSADGKTVTNNQHLSSPMGEADQKMVFEKQ